MMNPTSDRSSCRDGGVARLVRGTGLALLALAMLGATYLIWARGEAMLVDLSTLAGKVLCF
jgi:hypothetical protein